MPMPATLPTLHDELELIERWLPLDGLRLLEAGCGAARLARGLLARHPTTEWVGLEVDAVQHAKNLAAPAERMTFLAAGAQAIPCPDAGFDGALMLKSLHHVPLDAMDAALDELARVLRPGGWLYVSEPVYDGALNELVRLYNDEGVVRAAAQAALDRALLRGPWRAADEAWFETPVHFADFDAFERRMLRPSFATFEVDPALVARVAAAYAPHQGADGAHFTRPMHVRLLRRAA